MSLDSKGARGYDSLMTNTPIITDEFRAEYLEKARAMIEEWLRSAPGTQSPIVEYLFNDCPECECEPSDDSDWHEVYAGFVLIGCEGYWVINPNILPGFSSPNWHNREGEIPS